ncbi:MAG: bacillithiol biosynthesis deacetylase BshB1 [Acidobacteriota bacterium]
MNLEPVDILVIGAHADDIELSCGGTVALAVDAGQRVGLVDLTGGEMGTRGTAETRILESAAARDVLGARFREALDFGDGGLLTGREQELQLIEVIRRTRPAIVVAPYPDDRHPDHARAGRLVTDAAFYAGLAKLQTGPDTGTAHRPQAVLYYLLNYPVPPSFVVDISKVWRRKMDAIAAYGTQFYNPQSKEEEPTLLSKKSFIDWIEGRARHYGSLIGADYGEPFFSKQPPKVADLVAAYCGRELS